jgi:hypothetical protein
VNAWLAKHPRFKLHFTPTNASWLNVVERFFAEITRKRVRRGVFTSVADLKEAIHDHLDHHNANPKPFVCDQDRKGHPCQGAPRAGYPRKRQRRVTSSDSEH